ncbi:MAG TPA: hypothetical protein VJT84_12935 [Gaiellaceae bacterium]|nr:hypothetical protein [Gaiellaceae bacterium]
MTSEELPFDVPPMHELGACAHAAAVWFTAYDLTLDFAAFTDEPEGGGELVVVSRVRIPIGFAFELIRRINDAMGRYESTWGEIHYPD